MEASKRNNAKEEAFLRSCVGILLFGVPHQGLNRHSIQSLVKGRANEQFLGDLSTGSEFLFTLRSDFRNCFATMSCCEIVSIYETEDTNAVEVVLNLGLLRKYILTVKEKPGRYIGKIWPKHSYGTSRICNISDVGGL